MAETSGEPTYDVFISYSRKDSAFAALLEQALEAYRPPKDLDVPQRALEVFRDQQDFTGVEYSRALDRHLAASANMIVLCSPNSRASAFVDDEIGRFVARKGAERLVPVLVAGIPNNEGDPANPSDWAFPDALCEALPMPLAADYRGFDPKAHKLDRGAYAGAWYTTLANIYRTSRGELEQRDLIRRRKARTRAAVIAGATLAVLAAAGLLALRQSNRAVEQERIAAERKSVAQARQLALHANAVGDARDDLALLLSVESTRRADILESKQSLLASLLRRPQLEGFLWANGLSVTALQLSPDSKRLAAGLCQRSGDSCLTREIRLYDLTSRKPIRSIDREEGSPIKALAFSADGTLLAAGDQHDWLGILDVRTADTRHNFSLSMLGISRPLWGVSALAFSADGKQLAIGSCGRSGDMGSCVDGQVSIMETSAWQLVAKPITLAGRPIESMALDPKQDLWLLLSTCPRYRDGSGACRTVEIRPWSLGRQTFLADSASVALPSSEASMGARGGPTAVALAPHGDFIASAYCFKPEVFRCVQGALQFGLPDSVGASKPMVGHVSEILSLAASRDHKLLASGSKDGSIALWRTDGSSVLSESIAASAATFFAVAFDARGEKIAAAGCAEYRDRIPRQCQSGALFVVTAKDRTVAPLPLPDDVGTLRAVAFSHDGKRLAAGSDTNQLLLWTNLDETREPEVLLGPAGSVLALEFSPDARSLVAAGARGIVVWDVPLRKPRLHLGSDAKGSVLAVAVSPDGKMLATGGEDRAITIWDLDTPSNRKGATGHNGAVTALRFDATGKILVSAAEDGIAVWDVPTGQRRSLPFHGHQGPVISVALSPDGGTLASAGLDRRVVLWDVESGQALGPALSQDQAWRSVAFNPAGSIAAAVGHGSRINVFQTTTRSWREIACRRANRNLTRQEWSEYFGSEPYRETCGGFS
jgi:WD40 repeat protein